MAVEAVRQMNEAARGHRGTWPPRWPARLRIKRLQGTPGIWEMTWSYSGPDGRATFQFVDIDGEVGVCWRRIGDHGILDRP
jgi:hypothetical protein